jgi:hypothetical protein
VSFGAAATREPAAVPVVRLPAAVPVVLAVVLAAVLGARVALAGGGVGGSAGAAAGDGDKDAGNLEVVGRTGGVAAAGKGLVVVVVIGAAGLGWGCG